MHWNAKPPIVGACAHCGTGTTWSSRRAADYRQRGYGYCSRVCSDAARAIKIGASSAISTKRNAAYYSKRMRENNPMRDPAVVAKMVAKKKGCTFLGRGGNGKPTVPQLRLSEALSLPIEVVVLTASVAGQFASLPHHYKVDIGDEALRLAIEVDGESHKLRKWKFLDRRKESVLYALGWTVLRFWNQDVMENLEECGQTVLSTTWRLKGRTPT